LNRQHSNRAPPVSGFSSSPAFPRPTSHARPPDTARLRRPRALPAASPPPPSSSTTRRAGPPFSSSPILRFGSKPPSALAVLLNAKQQQPRRATGRCLTSPHRAISSKAGAVTTSSTDERHCSLPHCPSFAAESGRHLRRAHPASTRAGAVHRAGHNCCSPPSTDSIPGFFIPQ
jgi:hypothetical protein